MVCIHPVLTALDIKSAFLNQPIEVATLRRQFQSAILFQRRYANGLGNILPQLLIRFGYGKSMPQSLCRRVEQVLVTLIVFRKIRGDRLVSPELARCKLPTPEGKLRAQSVFSE